MANVKKLEEELKLLREERETLARTLEIKKERDRLDALQKELHPSKAKKFGEFLISTYKGLHEVGETLRKAEREKKKTQKKSMGKVM